MTRTLHVVPVGTSVLAHLPKGRLHNPTGTLAAAPTPEQPTPPPVRAVIREATGADATLDLAHLLGPDTLAALHVACGTLAAEWTSTDAATRQAPLSTQRDTLLLLASDTDDGLKAATLVAARYAGLGFRAHYADTPGDQPVLQPGELHLCRLPGLNLASGQPAPSTWHALGTIGRHLRRACERGEDRRILIHLNGGYKLLTPHLLIMATAINTALAEPGRSLSLDTVRAFVLHQDSTALPDGIVWIPIGSLPPTQWDTLRALAAEPVITRDRLDSTWDGDLLGQFIAADGDHRSLTAAGQITLGVL
ncbi:hypothetical protein [Kutzneria sp. 744]|uniref:hypothetical protein n=1 Tax=Kutzneria sp. (strain 744) TaxID=345341 RepID=UPI0005BA2F02|nr:hypothetical protein [Kutzneria sp. 744]